MEFSTLKKKKKASDLRFSGERSFVLNTNAPFVQLYSLLPLEEPAHTKNFLKSIKAHTSLSK